MALIFTYSTYHCSFVLKIIVNAKEKKTCQPLTWLQKVLERGPIIKEALGFTGVVNGAMKRAFSMVRSRVEGMDVRA